MNEFSVEFERYLEDRWNLNLKHYNLYGSYSFWERLWSDKNSVKTAYGDVERVDASTDYDDGRELRKMVVKIGGKFYQKTGYYDSWDSCSWDGQMHEVVPFEKTVIEYVPVC